MKISLITVIIIYVNGISADIKDVKKMVLYCPNIICEQLSVVQNKVMHCISSLSLHIIKKYKWVIPFQRVIYHIIIYVCSICAYTTVT